MEPASESFLSGCCNLSNMLPLAALLVVAVILKMTIFRAKGENPFRRDTRKPRASVVLDRNVRKQVLKNQFHQSKVPDSVDAIVIGSGIGGLATASLMAKANKKVLVLEQHSKAGGCCHTFSEKGFEFDVGIHYIGQMQENTMVRLLIDQLTDGQVSWEPLDDNFDTVVLTNKESGGPVKKVPLHAGKQAILQSLINAFPDEEKGIHQFFRLVHDSASTNLAFVLLKILPYRFCRFLVSSGMIHWFTRLFRYSGRSLKEVLDEVTSDDDLKTVLAYCFGDYGVPPSEASFFVHAILLRHFEKGGFYPVGGASEIAFHIIPTIEAAGGRVLTRAHVTAILDDGHGRVVGVRVAKGNEQVELRAPIVISDAGILNTVRMLSKDVLDRNPTPLPRIVSSLRPGYGFMSLFVGLRGTSEELDLHSRNYWIFNSNKVGQEFINMMNIRDQAEMVDIDIPMLFVSFPSAKDPTFQQRYPGNSCCTVVTFAPWEWFESWKDTPTNKRGDEYNEMKDRLGRNMWEQTCQIFPNLKDKVEYFELGTPLSNQHYIASTRGEIYGMNHDVPRFSAEAVVDMRPDTQIPGLYMTGQDVFTCGFVGAMFAGMFCASAVLQRNLHQDLAGLKKSLKKAN